MTAGMRLKRLTILVTAEFIVPGGTVFMGQSKLLDAFRQASASVVGKEAHIIPGEVTIAMVETEGEEV